MQHLDDLVAPPTVAATPMSPIAAEPDRAALTRALRDLESAKARVERDAQATADEMRKDLVLQLLPVLDNLDRTIKAADEHGDAPAVIEGVRLVRSQLEGTLRGYGVTVVDATNGRFDPRLHEAVALLPVIDPLANGIVLDQVEAGYKFGEQLLRPAKVVVAKYTAPASRPAPARWY